MSGILKPGEKIKSETSLNEVKGLVKSLYEFDDFTVEELNGYDDKNYKITLKDSESNKTKEYTFKILNSLDSKDPFLVEAQNSVMCFLNDKGIVCPKPTPDINGKYFSLQKFSSGLHVVRLLTYIPGTILHKTRPTTKLFYQIGHDTAKLNVILKDFHHTAFITRKTIWMMDFVPVMRQYLFAVDDNKKRVFEKIIIEFEERVLKNRDSLEKGIIHGDINEQNVLTAGKGDNLTFSGILDFGDVNYSCYLFELSILITYMMIVGKSIDCAGHVIAGYSKIRPIPEQEFSLLKVCALARICQSNVMGTYSSMQDPENLYILVSVEDGWRTLEKLLEESEEETLHRWKAIMNSYDKDNENS